MAEISVDNVNSAKQPRVVYKMLCPKCGWVGAVSHGYNPATRILTGQWMCLRLGCAHIFDASHGEELDQVPKEQISGTLSGETA